MDLFVPNFVTGALARLVVIVSREGDRELGWHTARVDGHHELGGGGGQGWPVSALILPQAALGVVGAILSWEEERELG